MGAIGHTNYPPGIDIASHHVTIEQDLRQQLQRFWELEEVSGDCPLTPDEAYCERLFATTHTRDTNGRYVVRLPRKQETSLEHGDSRCRALRLLLAAESRLRRNPSLFQSYVEFLNDYSELGHMEPVPEAEIKGNGSYYLPHHAVVKTANPSGKIRVVFNASFRTCTGASLNDLLLPGPKLQAELWLILTRWRLF
ncbi:uncharacterized protein LOC114945451 [Nylanderia fulva]|uniref:uncharacterized protein LOC114945451 n=1 Tax=Nylanderia fulva TaxID=613905 RepID=UPI0010FB8E3F|nr:uncharacterized protein LOC114945451 [Nylanderia fulva]